MYTIRATYESEDGSRHGEDSHEALGDERGREYETETEAEAAAARLRAGCDEWDYEVVFAE